MSRVEVAWKKYSKNLFIGNPDGYHRAKIMFYSGYLACAIDDKVSDTEDLALELADIIK